MVHILASMAFTLVALGSFALTALMLATARHEILQALGIAQAQTRPAPRRTVRVRTAGRLQTVSAPAAATSPRRAAA